MKIMSTNINSSISLTYSNICIYTTQPYLSRDLLLLFIIIITIKVAIYYYYYHHFCYLKIDVVSWTVCHYSRSQPVIFGVMALATLFTFTTLCSILAVPNEHGFCNISTDRSNITLAFPSIFQIYLQLSPMLLPLL